MKATEEVDKMVRYLIHGIHKPPKKKPKMTKQRRNFKGYDWMELVHFWNIKIRKLPLEEWMEEHPDIDEIHAWDKLVIDKCTDYVHDAVCKGGNRLKEVAQDIRAFLRALAKSKNSYYTPVWQGMLKIENDVGGNETLLKLTAIYLEKMWT